MTTDALLAGIIGVLSLVVTSVRMHRYSRGQVAVQATLTGRGLYQQDSRRHVLGRSSAPSALRADVMVAR
jgi:hypothetical protein